MNTATVVLTLALHLAVPGARAGEGDKPPASDKRVQELQDRLKSQEAEVERLKKELKERSTQLVEKRFKKGRVQVVERTWPKAARENIVIVHEPDEKDTVDTLLAGLTAPGVDEKGRWELAVPTRVVTVKAYLEAADKGEAWVSPRRIGSTVKKDVKDDLGWSFALVYRHRPPGSTP